MCGEEDNTLYVNPPILFQRIWWINEFDGLTGKLWQIKRFGG